MADMPVISVVIPTYNHARFLKSAIQSVLDQTFTDWEAIIVNNYSEDDTVEVVSSFDDSRLRLDNFRNHGVIAASRNRGIGLAKGRFIAFLDSDDVWCPEKLAYCLKALDAGCDVVCHGELWVRDGRPVKKVFYGPQKKTSYFSLLYGGNCLSTSAITVKKSALDRVGGFDEDPRIMTVEDYELWLRLAKDNCRFVCIDKILGEYRIHGENHSKAVMRNLEAELVVLQKHFFEITNHGVLSRLRMKRRFALAYYGAARGMQAESNHVGAMKLLFRSWIKYPFILKQYAAAVIGLSGCLISRRSITHNL